MKLRQKLRFLKNVGHKPRALSAAPHALEGLNNPTSETWEKHVYSLKQSFQQHIYGRLPKPVPHTILSRRLVAKGAYGGLGNVEDITLQFGEGKTAKKLNLVLITPTKEGPKTGFATILVPNICGNHMAVPKAKVQKPEAWYPQFICEKRPKIPFNKAIYGAHISAPPAVKVLKAGHALAIYTPGQIVPDHPEKAPDAIKTLLGADHTTGAIAAWAWVMQRVVDVLMNEPALDPRKIIAFGHSRNGKAALLATAFDDRIAMVIGHQSGTAGANLSRGLAGESITQITQTYPHWFSPNFKDAAESFPFDQHHLLASIAPRPILLGNARRDSWSDPHASFAAAQGTTPVYNLYGRTGCAQRCLKKPNYDADIALFMRRGFHGISRKDWKHFLKFIDAQLQK